jgi:hypothetical protein
MTDDDDLETLALRRAAMVHALHDALQAAMKGITDAVTEHASRRLPGLQESLLGELPAARVETHISDKLYYTLELAHPGGPGPLQAYVDMRWVPHMEEGVRLIFATLVSTKSRPKGASFSTLHAMLAGHACPGERSPRGTNNQRLWRSELHVTDTDSAQAAIEAIDPHLDSLPVVLRAWDQHCREVSG